MSHGKDEELDRFDNELEVDPEEAAQAEALAQMLAGKSRIQLPSEVSEAVALLRTAANHDLSAAALARIETEIAENLRRNVREEKGPRNGWWWVVLAALAPATFVVYLMSNPKSDSSEVPLTASNLPVPEVKVLQAQASWVISDAERGAFEREMQNYRGRILASLDGH
jgi:hypothetical protein